MVVAKKIKGGGGKQRIKVTGWQGAEGAWRAGRDASPKGAAAALQGPEGGSGHGRPPWAWLGSPALLLPGPACFLWAVEVLWEAIVGREGGNLATHSHS